MEQLINVILKSLLVFVMLIVLTRLMGRKLLAQITFFDFVVGITIGTIAGAYVTLDVRGPWVHLSPVILTASTITVGYLTVKSLPVRKILEGEPVIIIQNGKILENNMLKLRYNLDDLEMQLREKGIFDFSEVEFAVLEAHGKLSVLKKSQYLPLTPKDMNVSTKYIGMSTEIIKFGEVLEQNLRQNNLSFGWLYQELKNNNIDKIEDVAYAALSTDGSLYFDMKADNLKYVQKVED